MKYNEYTDGIEDPYEQADLVTAWVMKKLGQPLFTTRHALAKTNPDILAPSSRRPHVSKTALFRVAYEIEQLFDRESEEVDISGIGHLFQSPTLLTVAQAS